MLQYGLAIMHNDSRMGKKKVSTGSLNGSPSFASLINSFKYDEVVNKYISERLNTSQNPDESRAYAVALFKLGKVKECADVCSSLYSSYDQDENFVSMYGACLRRLGRISESKTVFESALTRGLNGSILINNYSNLLIDMGDSRHAIELLESISSSSPNYSDVIVNLKRARNAEESIKISEKGFAGLVRSGEANIEDPLIAAFGEGETYIGFQPNGESLSEFPAVKTELEIIERLNLIRATTNDSPVDTLKECSSIAQRLSFMQPIVFEVAAEAYIRLGRFESAEICLLYASVLGSEDPATFYNLATLAAMKKSSLKTIYWKDRLTQLCPSSEYTEKANEHVEKLKVVSKGKDGHELFGEQGFFMPGEFAKVL